MPAHHHKPNNSPLHARAHRVIASLNREQVDFLDKIGKDALFSAGIKLSRTEILAAMVNVLKRFHLTGDGVKTVEQFERRIVKAVTQQRGGHVTPQLTERQRRKLSGGT